MNYILPKLYCESSSGKTKEWEIKVVNWGEYSEIVTNFGYKDGKKQETIEKISSGKNIGKANQTTPYEQAVSEALSKWQKKKDKNYSENKLSEKENLLPMLALKFKERSHDITYPAIVQPKLNGVRCLAKKVSEDEIEYTSRSGKKWCFFEHLTKELLPIMEIGDIFDGEIFSRKFTFQEITNLIKKEKEQTKDLEYWVYDMISNEDFINRNLCLLSKISNYTLSKIVCVPNFMVVDKEEVFYKHNQFIENNFEGTMVRNLKGSYVCDYRSPNLQKLKKVIDAEFKIVGGKSGKAKFEGCCTFTCDNGKGKTFDVVPKGSIELKKEYLKNIDKYIGKMLTVEFEDYSSDNIPLKPVGIAVRDYE